MQQVPLELMVYKDRRDHLVLMVLLVLKAHRELQDQKVPQDHKVQLQQLSVLVQQQH